MKRIGTWVVGLVVVSLLAAGVVAVAGSFGGRLQERQAAGSDCTLGGQDEDGDGILNCEDSDWIRPLDARCVADSSPGTCHTGDGYGPWRGAGASQQSGVRGGCRR